ncbi:DUF3277 family protein [bacterium]|nr:DUF3277 family protein [bacterium]
MTTTPYNSVDHALYVTTYDDITFAVQGKPDGDYIAVTYDNDAIQAVAGVDGDVQFSQIKASLGTITATNQWGSPWNANMNHCFRNQQAGNYLKKLEVKRISASENTTIWSTGRPMIVKTPDYSIGSKANDRAWAFKVENLVPGEFTAPV